MKKKILTLILLIITTVLVFASCTDSGDSAVRYTSATDSSSYILDIDTAALTFDLEITTSAGTQTVNGSYTTDSATGIVTLTYTENDTTKNIYITLDTANGIFSLLTYTVTWKSQDGSETYETDENILYGTVPDFGGAMPSKSITAQYRFTFSGWSTEIDAESGTAEAALAAVNGNVTYYAAFAKTNVYIVTVESSNSVYGTVSSAGVECVSDGSVITVDGAAVTVSGQTVTASATADDAQYDYAFTGWSIANGATVTGAVTVTAYFTRSAAKFEYVYEVSGGNATITGYKANSNLEGNLIIPSEIDGYTVTGIGEGALCETLITGITIPSSVTVIGDYAFCSSLGLTSITIPSSVTSIGDNTFGGCYKLVHIRNLSGITVANCASIGGEVVNAEDSFTNTLTDDDSGVITYTVGGKVYLMGYTGSDTAFDLSAYTSITDVYPYAFSESALTGITLPGSVTNIGEYAFYYCEKLADCELPSSVLSIGNCAFANDIKLSRMTIPNGAATIGDYAFAYCLNLCSVSIPSTVTSIGAAIFDGCYKLVQFKNCSGITVSCFAATDAEIITEGAFANTLDVDANGVITYTVGGKVYLIGYVGESAAPDLSAYTSITDVYPYAFSESALTGITLPDSVTGIGEYAFGSCRQLAYFDFPSSIKSIGNYAFQVCSKLSEVTVPEGVTAIGDGVFMCCDNLISISIPSTATSIGSNICEACYKLVHIRNCSGVAVSSFAPIGAETVTTAEGDFTNTLTEDDSGIITYTVGDKVYLMGYTGNDTALDLSEYEVTDIYPNAFYDALITGIILPDSLTSIGESAFYYCFALANVTMPDSLVSIGRYAFYNCSSLTSVTIPSSVTFIGINAFAYCYVLTDVTMPDSLASIGSYAFYYCNSLTSVTIPSSVTFIGINAFAYCYALTEVTFENIDGWYYTSDPNASSGTPIDVSVASDNAAELKQDSSSSPKNYNRMSD